MKTTRRLAVLMLAACMLSGCTYPFRCSPSWFHRCGPAKEQPKPKPQPPLKPGEVRCYDHMGDVIPCPEEQ